MKKYIPISCDVYDILTLHSMHRDVVHIKFSLIDQEDGFSKRTGMITDIFTKESVEYLQLNDDGPVLRLDQIVEIIKEQ